MRGRRVVFGLGPLAGAAGAAAGAAGAAHRCLRDQLRVPRCAGRIQVPITSLVQQLYAYSITIIIVSTS